jgi:hypothetical protein
MGQVAIEDIVSVELADNLDTMAVVVDWLDCCRSCNLDALLDLYAEDASLECACEGIRINGRAQLAAYWKPKLSRMSPGAFGLEEITPHPDGVALDYLSFENRPVRVFFGFAPSGKISHTPALSTTRTVLKALTQTQPSSMDRN